MFEFLRKKILLPEDEFMKVARAIAVSFSTGDLLNRNLDGHGISKMQVRHNGKKVLVSWYSSGNPCELIIDGRRSFPEGRASSVILSAAKKRADSLIKEDLLHISSKEGE